jgi:stearoyl-CoA desaturase (delta-9 desaturase)
LIWIVAFFVGHWGFSCFFQSFFLHRYGAHRQFTMNKAWERIFYLGTFVSQGSSYLVPRSYAVMHREHHAFSDHPGDPHSPHVYPNLFKMMWATKQRYAGIVKRRVQAESRFEGGYPEWKWLDSFGDHWGVRIGWGALYTLFYVVFAPHWTLYLLLPIHFLMGPVHGSIVNWCGHKYGYRNFDCKDQSRNTLPFDFLTLGELFQNNHHRHGQSPNFGARWFEVDPTYYVMRVMAALGILRFQRTQTLPA